MRVLRILSLVSFLAMFSNCALAQGSLLPWGQSSDAVAWEVFVQVLAPSGNPQTTNIEFETWASDQDVYVKSPPQWPTVGAPKQLHVSPLGLSRHGESILTITPGQCSLAIGGRATATAAGFPTDACIGEETRRNWASFQYIVSNQLYSKTGLAKAFQSGLKVDLPADAIEVKGDWVKVVDIMHWLKLTSEQVHQNYYTNKATDGTTTDEYALVSFHFSSKQIKNWVWADFEHERTPGRCDFIGCRDSFGATHKNVSPLPGLNQDYGACQKSDAVQAMITNAGLSSVFQHYCLKGSQIAFINSDGSDSKLGNAVIEGFNANVPIIKSSCISCHSAASFDKTGSPNFQALGQNLTGNVDPSWLKGFVTNDFIWGNICTNPGAC